MNKFDIDFFFMIFAFLSFFSSLFVIISKNPMHSIISLIFVFCNIVFILLLQKIEFLAMVLLIVYVGAIAVLFLFVVYMLNINIINLNEINWKHSLGLLFTLLYFILLYILIFFYYNYNLTNLFFINFIEDIRIINYYSLWFEIMPISSLAHLLYEKNYLCIILLSIILIIAMIGTIILTARKSLFIKEQNIFNQNKRFIKNK